MKRDPHIRPINETYELAPTKALHKKIKEIKTISGKPDIRESKERDPYIRPIKETHELALYLPPGIERERVCI